MIEVHHLTKKYGSNVAVDDLSFTVEKGQIYGFLGPNGAGKSTTMNMMTGYIAPTAGQVLIDGHDIVEEAQAARRSIGYLPEIPPVYPEMTVEEYLEFAAGLKKIPSALVDENIAKVMELTGITEVENRLIRNLSKGFRQRVGLAQAILGDPEILILDEPMVGLDPKQIIEIRELIKELSDNHTIILSSHILSEISAICDHIMIIAHGKLVASDTPDNLARLMKGSGSLHITAAGDQTAITFALSGVENIEDITFSPSQEEGAVDLDISIKEGADIRRDVFFALAKENLPILEMTHTHVSLEDIFLELTEEKEQPENTAEGRSPFFRRKKDRTGADEKNGGEEA